MSMSSPEWDEIKDAVERAARAVARKYSTFTTFDDLCQDGYEWFLRSPDRLTHYEMRDGTIYRNALVADLIGHLTRVAKRERTALLGLRPGDQFTYNAELVEMILPAVWDASYRPPAVEAAGRTNTDPSVTGNWEAMVADVRSAVDELPARMRRVLLAYHGVSPVGGWREAAISLGMSKTAANDLGRQSIARVVDILNGVPDEDVSEPRHVTGLRRVMSNAAAAAVTANQYDGE